jgi:hypothetical protein
MRVHVFRAFLATAVVQQLCVGEVPTHDAIFDVRCRSCAAFDCRWQILGECDHLSRSIDHSCVLIRPSAMVLLKRQTKKIQKAHKLPHEVTSTNDYLAGQRATLSTSQLEMLELADVTCLDSHLVFSRQRRPHSDNDLSQKQFAIVRQEGSDSRTCNPALSE